MNSGDWIENLSALECVNGVWSIYKFSEEDRQGMLIKEEELEEDLNTNELFNNLVQEFNLMRS